MSNPSYTGHRRHRKTPRSVARAEKTARFLIYAGGFGTIVAIVLIFGFLLSVVVPLFGGAEAGPERTVAREPGGDVLAIGVDEYRTTAWTLHRDGTLRTRAYRTGRPIVTTKVFDGSGLTASAHQVEPKNRPEDDSRIRFVLGFRDGSLRLLALRAQVETKELPDVPEELRSLGVGEQAAYEDGVLERTPKHQFRLVRLVPELEDPVPAAKGAILHVDLSYPPSGRAIGYLSESRELVIATLAQKLNMLTGKRELVARKRVLPYSAPKGRDLPAHVALTGSTNELFLVWPDGYAIRYDSRAYGDDGGAIPDARRQAEKLKLLPDGRRVSSLGFLNGKVTLLVGDDAGRIHLWFASRPEKPTTVDGLEMVRARVLAGPPSDVTAFGTTARSRMLLAGFENGEVRAYQATQGTELGALTIGSSTPVRAVAFAPKEDAILADAGAALHTWDFDAGYHDISLRTMFGKVHYERQAEPEHTWQSGGTDDAEPKFGLMPLIFGTLKATLYSMLMAIPIALLAAIYTTEFMRPSARAPVKSVIEMMASLPSVVLGFLAALVVAPFVAGVLPATLSALLTVPFAFLLGARLWQLLPSQKALLWGGTPKFAFMALMLPLGLGFAALLGPVVENFLYGGDVRRWLGAEPGSGGAVGGWVFILLPVSFLLLSVAWSLWGAPWLRSRSFDWERGTCARFDLGRLFALAVASLLLALALAYLAAKSGWDPRADFMGKYSPRNALIVGFAMAFAIVPIIYTLAEDALSGVPSQLREGSLGAGATPWQTAVRIIIPTAMSGIFGAIMVGLGRAVGETMIVLMAAGNTPLMEWNLFNGFRTLSANIATELPEAPRGGSLYRLLFLSALVLFAMTFVINTLAEVVRRRFRARYSEQL